MLIFLERLSSVTTQIRVHRTLIQIPALIFQHPELLEAFSLSSILAIWASHRPGQLARKGDYSFLVSFLKQICEFVPSL